jgi:hypothetical protein
MILIDGIWVKESRRFNGKLYKLRAIYKSKTKALKYADYWRQKGRTFLARVVHGHSIYWYVYVR